MGTFSYTQSNLGSRVWQVPSVVILDFMLEDGVLLPSEFLGV